MDRRNKNDYRELCYLATLKVKKLNTSFDRSNSFRDMCRFIMTYSDDIPKFKKGRNYNPDFVVAVVLDFLYTLDSRYYTIAKEIILRDKIKIYNSDAIDLFLNNDNDDSILEDGPCVIFDEGVIFNNSTTSAKPYMIYCPLMGNIGDIYSLTHELIHAIDYELNGYEYDYSHELITEVPSYLAEVLLSEYLANNVSIGEIRNEEVKDLNDNNKLDALRLYKISIFLEIIEKEGRITASNLKRYFRDNDLPFSHKYLYRTLKDFTTYDIYSFNYLSKYVIAHYIKEQYRTLNKDNKVDKLEQFKTFLEFYQEYDIDKSIGLLGIKTKLEGKKELKSRKMYKMLEIE